LYPLRFLKTTTNPGNWKTNAGNKCMVGEDSKKKEGRYHNTRWAVHAWETIPNEV